MIEKWFGAWKVAGAKPGSDACRHGSGANQPSAAHVADPEAACRIQVELALQLPMNRFDHDYYALQLGDHVLGGGFYATRLWYRDLRQKAGYVYNVDNSLHAGETRAAYSVTYGCDPENVSKARTLVDQELTAMRTTNVTAAELQQAKALLLRQITLSESSEDGVASGFVARAVIGLPLDESTRAAQRYYATSHGGRDPRGVLRSGIHPNAFGASGAGDRPRSRAGGAILSC